MCCQGSDQDQTENSQKYSRICKITFGNAADIGTNTTVFEAKISDIETNGSSDRNFQVLRDCLYDQVTHTKDCQQQENTTGNQRHGHDTAEGNLTICQHGTKHCITSHTGSQSKRQVRI